MPGSGPASISRMRPWAVRWSASAVSSAASRPSRFLEAPGEGTGAHRRVRGQLVQRQRQFKPLQCPVAGQPGAGCARRRQWPLDVLCLPAVPVRRHDAEAGDLVDEKNAGVELDPGNSSRKWSLSAQWVVARRPSRRPAPDSPAGRAAGGRLLSRGSRVVAHEAGITQRVVLIEFDSFEQAAAAYESEAYQKALVALPDGFERDFRIIEGID
jgi:uncharacterized protein (DUF1330 family)